MRESWNPIAFRSTGWLANKRCEAEPCSRVLVERTTGHSRCVCLRVNDSTQSLNACHHARGSQAHASSYGHHNTAPMHLAQLTRAALHDAAVRISADRVTALCSGPCSVVVHWCVHASSQQDCFSDRSLRPLARDWRCTGIPTGSRVAGEMPVQKKRTKRRKTTGASRDADDDESEVFYVRHAKPLAFVDCACTCVRVSMGRRDRFDGARLQRCWRVIPLHVVVGGVSVLWCGGKVRLVE